MTFTISTRKLSELKAEALVAFLGQDKISAEEKLLDKFFGGELKALRASKDFTGEAGKVRILYGKKTASRLVLVGLGKTDQLDLEKLREAGSAAAQALKNLPVTRTSVLIPKIPRSQTSQIIQALCESLALASYEFAYYKTAKKDKPQLEYVELIIGQEQKREAEKSLSIAQILTRAVIAARDLGNHPANIATPEHLAKHAQDLARKFPNKVLRVKILHQADIEREKMGALLAVSKGSDEEPKFIILEYYGKPARRKGGKKAPVVALIGKGITFDSGGINIKPSEKMEEMKYDMAGAATVMETIRAAAELGLPLNLVGLIPATENLPSGKATKPGDIIKSRSGKTVEVVNTDAEGRLVLSDALDYAKQYKPDLVIDFATLTGSIMVALGDDITGAFGNHEKYLNQLQSAAKTTGEKIWPMPLEKDYESFVKSDFADLRNQATIRYGDAIHAANFLKNFVDYPWIHLDIAGVAWATREKPYRPKGATGTGLRLVIEFLRKFRK